MKHLAKDPGVFTSKNGKVIEEKLEGKTLLLDNVESMRLARNQNKRRGAQEGDGKHLMGASERRRLDRLTAQDVFSYERQLLPLHRLWLAYIKDLLSITQYVADHVPFRPSC